MQSPWMLQDPQVMKRLLLAGNGGPQPNVPPAPPPGAPKTPFYPPGMTGGAQVPSSVPPMFLPGQQPGATRAPAATPSPWASFGPSGSAPAPSGLLPALRGAVQTEEHSADNQTGYSGADATTGRQGKAPVASGVPAASTAPVAGGQESTPTGQLQQAGARAPTSSFSAPFGFFGPAQKQMLTSLLPEVGDQNYLGQGGALPRFDPFSGQGETSSAKGEESTTEAEHVTEPIPEGSYGEAYNRMLQGTPGLRMERSDTDTLRKGVGALGSMVANRSPIGWLDLGPLMSLTDAWTGSNFAKNYRPPQNYLQPLADFAKTLSGTEFNLSAGELNLLRSQLGDYVNRGVNSDVQGQRGAQSGGMGQHLDPYKPMELALQAHAQERADQKETREAGQQSSADIQKAQANMPAEDLYQALQQLDQMAKASKANGQPMPGYKQVPGTNRDIRVPNAINGIMNDQMAQTLNRDIAILQNAEMHDEFGARQTAVELRRNAAQMGISAFNTSDQLKQALRDYTKAAQKHLERTIEGLPPEAQKLYRSNPKFRQPSDFNFDFGTGSGGGATSAPAPGAGGKSVKEQLMEKLRGAPAK